MKKLMHVFSVISLVLLFSSSAIAYPLTIGDPGVDVGLFDTLIAQSSPQNNAEELAFINAQLGTDYVTLSKDEDLAGDWVQVNEDPYAYAYDFEAYFGTSPEFYLLKIGGGNATGNTAFLYDNNVNLRYAVIDIQDLDLKNIDITAISHVSAAPAPVPEPSTLLLLGAGLAGLAVYRRKRK